RGMVSVFTGMSGFVKKNWGSGPSIIVGLLMGTPFLIAIIVFTKFFSSDSPVLTIILILAHVVIIIVFAVLLKAPTRLGRRVMDDIEGFRDYLSVAEGDMMDMLNPPEKTPELFEKFLPYAIALDVENRWADKFESVLAAAQQGPWKGQYQPTWYAGRSSRAFSARSFSSSLSSSFSTAIASASTPPRSTSSGSGSFGGGSSGGGGGGGGGW
ncbi:MAG: DUF2207 domain-containing protein, partial [Proteobacteria bacterium]|nr:DUF2207 domain-containing protein [Pseudomonadota bacterium]